MKRKAYFSLILAASILCGFVSCRTIQIVPEEKPPQEKAQREKTTQEKTIPQEAPQHEVAQKKGFLERMFQKIIPQDTFTRIYALDFGSFHGRVNTALQDYANTHKGNFFQIARLGSNAVILRGVYLREGGREKYVSTLTIKPIASKKCQLEIKFDISAGGSISSNPDEAAKEIFQIIENATR